MISRRGFLEQTAASLAIASSAGVRGQSHAVRLRPGGNEGGFDPWLEVIAPHFRHNVKEVARLAGGRPILAVVKNNAYGLGDGIVGPLLSRCAETAAIACVRPAEALAMRAAGVRKPILTMAELGEQEIELYVGTSRSPVGWMMPLCDWNELPKARGVQCRSICISTPE